VAAARLLEIIEAKFGDGLKAARMPGARAPGPDAESLRLAYLDVLKLTLCELGGTRTSSVARTFEGEVMSRELESEQLLFRTAGMDWPLHGLTMVGLARLDDLQRCVEDVVRDGIEGDLIEAGTWRGGASILMRATLDSLGAGDRRLWVADSFQGFPRAPAADADGYSLDADLSAVDYLAVPLEEVRQNFARFGLDHDVEFVPGFFEETLPALAGRRWALVRLDGDTYEATRVSLEVLYPGLAAGGHLVIDDYLQLDPCHEAVDEFRREHGITEPIEPIDWSGARWRKRTEAAPGRVTGPSAARPNGAARQAVERKPLARVPAIEEVELRHELERMRERLAAAEAEIERLTADPMRRVLGGIKRRIRAKR
jgi:Macrocin-O-methyltransferase (TylF)